MTSIGQKLLLLPAFLLTLGGPGLAAATTYFVDAVNGTAGGDGSAGSPWQTITQAMTSGTLIAGDTVTVASGTYDAALGEVFPIGFVDGVSLSGPGDGSASVEFSGVDAIAIDPTTGTSSVEGLRFVAGGTTQVSALLASATASGGGLHVLDNTFSAAGDHRFVALGDLPDTLIVDGNEATTLGNLVRCVVPSSTFAAASITISSNTMNGGDGVYLQLGSGAVATQVLISGNMAFGPELRLDCRGDAQVSGFLVSGNTCTAPASGSTIASGIRLTATSSAQLLDPTITGNILMDEGDIEVSVEDAAVVSGLTVSGNTLSGGTFNDNGGGISIELSETATVANLTVSDNLLMHGGDLACFFGYPDVVATDPVIHNNTLSGGNGINGGDLNLTISHSNYYGTSLNIVTNLTVTDNTLTPGATTVGAGLLYLGQLYGARANGTISGNSITGAADSGVYILRSSGEYGPSVCDFVFENNTVTGSGTDGFTIDLTQEESTGVVDLSYVLRGNTITDSVEHGIDMEFTQYEDSATVDFVLENNTITGNGSHGFWFTIDNFSKSTGTGSVADFDLTLVGNTISNNDGNGLRLSADADPNSNQVDFEIDARFNAFKDNGGAGVILAVEANPVGTNDVHATFDSNSIRDNTVEGLRFEHLFHPATFDIPNLTLSGCNTISGNGTNMDVVLALPMTGAPTFSHVTVDATENWWGTTTLADIEARVTHNPDDAALGVVDFSSPFPDTLTISTVPIVTSGDTVTVDAGALTAFVPYIGATPGALLISGDIDGTPVEDIVVAPDRQSLTFLAPAGLAAGGATLTITNPEGQSGSTTIDVPLGASFCGPAVLNSTGLPGRIQAIGSDSLGDEDVTLVASDLPPGEFGIFLAGPGSGSSAPAASCGVFCLFGGDPSLLGRFGGMSTFVVDSFGGASLEIDVTAIPIAGGSDPAGPFTRALQPGDTWNFQAWHRDDGSVCAQANNFTDAVSILFQ